ncbi:ABC transporter [Alcanivorax sp. N3-2A]|nr:ABC transporter [Alcanivorax sp. N3-2A]|tara:strand:+ start:9726 stop:10565 length:840 start_codon:yes stop_codon:yes gene_type:complete
MNKGVIVRTWILALLWLPLVAVADPFDEPATASDQAAVNSAPAESEDDDWGDANTAFDSPGTAYNYEEQDPWEGFNRKIFGFNDTVDRYAIKPAAKGYRWLTPQWLDNTVTRFFQNLHDLTSGVNYVFQWKWGNAFDSFGRFSFNSTVGVAGLFDVASKLNIPKHSTSLDRTLGRWGVHTGPYLVLPILGPSSVRDTATLYPAAYMWPVTYIDDDLTRYGVAALYGIDLRADLLDLEKNIVGDRYTFIRNAYLQQRLQGQGGDAAFPERSDEIERNEGW